MNFGKWIRQPSTIDGIGWMVGVVAYGVAHVLTHEETVSAALGGVLKGAVHLAINDTSAEAPVDNSLETLVRDTVTAAAQKKVEAAIPTLTLDMLSLLQTGQVALATAAVAHPAALPAVAPAAPVAASPAAA